MSEVGGGIHYVITIDTSQMVQQARAVDRELGKVETSLTQVSLAAKKHIAITQIEAKVVKELAATSEAAAGSTKTLGEATKKAAGDADKYVASTKQVAAALRGVPAQMTDIATSLQGGQNPLTVLLQQGGQLKDMFGGVGPAVSAVGGYIAKLINPVTVAGAVVAALAAAFFKGEEEAIAFSAAIELTGNRSGVTVDQLGTMATRLDALAGITRGQASDALNIFVSAGIRAGDSLGRLTESAIRMEQAAGTPIEATAKAFRDLEKDPLTAALKLNEAVNFLSKSTYQQAAALVEQGKQTEAVKLLQNEFADSLLARAPKLIENVGLMERAWRGLKNAAKEAWDEMLNIGRDKTVDQQIAATEAKIAELQNRIGMRGKVASSGRRSSTDDAEMATLNARLQSLRSSASYAKDAADADARRATTVAATAQWDKVLSDRAKMERDIAQARELGLQAGASEVEIEQRIKAIRESYSNKGGQKFDAAGYLAGLAEKAADEWDKIDIIEREALRKNQQHFADLSPEQFEQASLLIAQEASQQRQALQDREDAERLKRIDETNREELDRLKRNAAERQTVLGQLEAEMTAQNERRAQGQQFAQDVSFAGDPIAQLQAELEAKSAKLKEYAQLDQSNAELYARARVNLEQQTNEKIRAIVTKTGTENLDKFATMFGSITEVTRNFAGEQSGAYKAMFAVSKAFSIAQSIVAINTALAIAAESGPYPSNLAAMATVAAATAGLISNIKGANYGGGRQYGGPVSSGSLYRVNETGRPEMFTAANGSQYMIPTANGNVTPANEIGGAGGTTLQVQIINNHPAAQVSASTDQTGRIAQIVISQIVDSFSSNSGAPWNALRGSSNVEGRMS